MKHHQISSINYTLNIKQHSNLWSFLSINNFHMYFRYYKHMMDLNISYTFIDLLQDQYHMFLLMSKEWLLHIYH